MAPRIPLQGIPGHANGRNPTLIPNFDTPFANGSTIDLENPGTFNAQNPRVPAEATATIGGSVTSGDKITLVLTNPIFGGLQFGKLAPAEISHTYTATGSDTVTTIAEQLADLFNDDATAQGADIRVDVSGAVLTFRHAGAVGNFSALTAGQELPGTLTVGGTARTGDTLNVLFTGPAVETLTPATVEAILAGGPYVAGDTVELTFTNTSIATFPQSVTYTLVAGDTPASVAIGLAALVNGKAALTAQNVAAVATGNVVDLSQQGAIGNSTTVSATISGSETVTFQPGSGTMSGGTGQVGGVLVSIAPTTAQSTSTMATNLAAAITADAVLTALGISGSASSAIITMTIPAAAEPLTMTPWVNANAPTLTIGGSPISAGDTVTATVTNPALPGGAHSVTHTVLIGETTTTLATNLTAAINADPVFIAAGITALSSSAVITFSYEAANGQFRPSGSASGSETVTPSTAPTETLVVGSTATETIVIGSGSTAVVAASNVATVTGAGVAADTVALTFTNPGIASFPHTVTYTCVGTDSATTIAAGLVALIKADAVLQAANVTASNSSGAITVNQQGAIGNTTVLSVVVTGTGSEAITFNPSNGHLGGGAGLVGPAFSGGSGPVYATENFEWGNNGQVQAFFYGKGYILSYDFLSQLVNQGQPIV